ncbi:pirin family protein [Formosa sp. Hel1_33_131]|uniref:pirin family protein n=1 Tax=Formosa sp. Hel1_33_131 TaxID=1336794 RepID=UPI00084E146A|nr:pirin family protein [Formosa sp. Hel1_33_131]
MTLVFHSASSRGFANHGWLQANHSFSFANFYDPKKMNFGALRVLNDDLIAPSMGFGTHPHDNMEIITIPLSGLLKHKDSMGNSWEEVKAGEVQVMSAGTGIHHSEINGSVSESLSLFQIWIVPNQNNVTPRYDQHYFDQSPDGELQILVSSIEEGSTDSSLKIHQDAQISRVNLSANTFFEYSLKSSNHGVYMMQVFGASKIETTALNPRDAVGISETKDFKIEATEDSQFLFIEVPVTFKES